MASAPLPQASDPVQAFAAEHHGASGAARFGIDAAQLAAMLAELVRQRGGGSQPQEVLGPLHLEEWVLTRACMAGHDGAWELFLTRYRVPMYEAAYAIAHDEAVGHALADSLYAELYGMNDRGEVRASKLRYYLGRGSLAGWLRTILAQEYVNQYRRTKRETSLEAALEDGQQFAAASAPAQHMDSRVEAATAAELTALDAEERFLLAAYYLDGRTLAEIAKLMRVHESTISRRLDRSTSSLRKRIRKRLTTAGMNGRQADEAMEEVDVRDLQLSVTESLQQDPARLTFYKKSGEEG